ncbi:MAG: tail fiber domain-containing protein, partial [Flavobacteriales bacterium]
NETLLQNSDHNLGINSGNPTAKLEITRDVPLSDTPEPQFRLKTSDRIGIIGLIDFHATNSGNLLIDPFNINPFSNDTIPANVGINLSLNDQPTHRLDVNGQTRIREVNQNDTLNKVLVENDKGVVHWRNAGTIGDKDWKVSGQDVVSAYTNSNGFPENRVGIGTDNPQSGKLDVRGNDQAAIGSFGLYAIAGSFSTDNDNAETNIGVFGKASENANYGGWFKGTNGFVNIGVKAIGGEIGINAEGGTYAGRFKNDIIVDGDVIADNVSASDIRLKTDTSNIINALNTINQLNPIQFYFDTTNYSHLNLSPKKQYGLIAQEVENTLPELVKEYIVPADLDSAGNVIRQKEKFKALNYERIIPFLIKGIQQQQTSIDSLQQELDSANTLAEKQDSINKSHAKRLAALESCVNNLPNGLCSSNKSAKTGDNGNSSATQMVLNTEVEIVPHESMKKTKLSQNEPNPFRYTTTFSYELAKKGKVELKVRTPAGKLVKKLVSEHQSSGAHKVKWDASNVDAGVYFYTLKVDGVQWVKKAIKLK